MKTPPLLLGAALLFWGQQAGLPWLGLALGLGLELSRLYRPSWDPGLKEFSRISDLCSVALAALAVYLYVSRPAVEAFSALVKLSVLPLYPVALAQAWSARGAIDAGALLYSLRRGAAPGGGPYVDVTLPFFVACLLAAGAANVRGPVFYPGAALLFCWLLWTVKPARVRAYAWLPPLLLAAALGHAGHKALYGLQQVLEVKGGELIFGSAGEGDPYRSRTAIGSVGEIKQSGRVVLRLKKYGPGRVPALLRESCFDSYKAGEWRAKDAPFAPAAPAPGGWALGTGAGEARFSVYARFVKGRGLLALPAGARTVAELPAEEVSVNRLGTARADGAPGRAVYEVSWAGEAGAGRDANPGPADLALPDGEAAVARREAARLGLAKMPPEKALAVLHAYFSREFRYTLYQRGAERGGSPVERFLTVTRAGHCEYFATATALLLRAAGIPARYATGYSVQEYSRVQRAYLVRQRHAHAWALAWVNGAWVDADNTPSTWLDAESARAGAAEPLLSAWSWLAYNFFTLRPGLPGSGGGAPYALAAALGAAGLWLLLRRRGRRAAPAAGEPPRSGMDSEFFAVEAELARGGLGRRPGESLRGWALRLGDPASGVKRSGELAGLAALHGRLRFDPAGLTPEERERLRGGSLAWLAARKKEEK